MGYDFVTAVPVNLLLPIVIAWLLAAAPEVLWALRAPFVAASWLAWRLANPLRPALADPTSPWPRRLYLLSLPALLLWGVALWTLWLPVRAAEAVYYDLLLFPAVGLRDAALDTLAPRRGAYRGLEGRAYALAWLTGLPRRLVELAVRLPRLGFQAAAMALMDLVWPSLTLYHGTRFQQGATSIAQTGLWLVGRGDYVGEGIYFGVNSTTARYYAQASTGGSGAPAVLVARVTLWPCRPVASLHPDARRRLGAHDSRELSGLLPWPWAALEHWREDRGWWEYCLVQPGQQGRYVSSWRIRPVCVVHEGVPAAIRSGLAMWPLGPDAWAVLAATAAATALVAIELWPG